MAVSANRLELLQIADAVARDVQHLVDHVDEVKGAVEGALKEFGKQFVAAAAVVA